MKAVILNHTGFEHHHGCRLVMDHIYRQLGARGIKVIAASPVRYKWWRSVAMMRAIGQADVIVINGEGTLHHGAGHGEKLLQVVDHPARRGAPVVLINALYQDNPPEWRRYLERLAFVSVRDTRSQGELRALGVEAHFTPDFSMAGASAASGTRSAHLIGFGDSVLPDATAELRRLRRAHGSDAVSLPIWASLEHWAFPNAPPLLYLLNTPSLLGVAAARVLDPGTRCFARESQFMEALSGLALFVTGRFHGVAMAMRTRTPFIAATSNSHKIEALLQDAGLEARRVVELSRLARINAAEWAYSDAESTAISAFLTRAEQGSGVVFDTIARLADQRAG